MPVMAETVISPEFPPPEVYAVAMTVNVPMMPEASGKTPPAVTGTVPGHMNPDVPVDTVPLRPQ